MSMDYFSRRDNRQVVNGEDASGRTLDNVTDTCREQQ